MKEGNSIVERPDASEWASKNRPVRKVKSSRGKCLCCTLLESHDCGGYSPIQSGPAPAICKWLDSISGSLCNFEGGKS